MAWPGVLADLKNARFPRAAGAAGIDASSRLRHVTDPCKTAINFFGGVCRWEDSVPVMAEGVSMTVDADAIICPYARFGRYPGKRGSDDAFLIPKENPPEEPMPDQKAIHEIPPEIPGTVPAGARSQAVSLPGRQRESDWSAYKGRPAARPAPPPKAPAPPPKQTPAPAPGAPNPPAPAKETDVGQGPQK